MALNIKNPLAEELARQVAAKTGESLADAVIHALEERLQRLGSQCTAKDIADELHKIALRCSAPLDMDQLSADEISDHDERGLPS